MEKDVVVQLDRVWKKYCRSLKSSMWYGFHDVLRDTIGISSKSEKLRAKEFWSVNDVSFKLRKGEWLGLIGPNGAGKTTLLKMLNGIIRPDRGRIKIKGRVAALIQLGAGFHPQLTGRENIYINGTILGMSKKEIDSKFEKIVDFADIGDFLDSPVKFYSSGMFVRLGMAVALHIDPQILLVDEVFAVGDIKFQVQCLNRFGTLRRNGTSFIFVSHNIHHISGYSDRVLVLNHGKEYALGEPKLIVKKYLELMRSKPMEESSQGDESPNGSGRIRFTHVEFLDNVGNTLNSVDATSPFSLKIDYKAVLDCDETELDMVIYDSGNGVFFQASNLLYNQRLQIIKGEGNITVRFPYLPKNEGLLYFTIAIWSKDRRELFDWRRAIELNVSGCSLSSGAVWLPCSFEVNFYE